MKQTKIILIIVMLLTSILGTAYAQESGNNQIGLLLWGGPDGFTAKMTELGYVEGENLTYMYLPVIENLTYGTEEYQAEYEKNIQAMVDGGVDVFVVETDSEAVYLRELVGNVPIVFARADDPVASGAVADLVNPGGSITGNITNRPHERRLQLLTEIEPTTKKVYYLISSYALGADVTLQQVQAVADELGVEIVTATLTMEPGSALSAVENMPEDTDWVFMTPYVFLDEEANAALTTLTVERHIGLAFITDDPAQGYVISYGPSVSDSSGQAALLVDRILRGASPADLPVQTAENYLTINLEAAEAVGIEIPESILRQANLIVRPGYFETLATPAG